MVQQIIKEQKLFLSIYLIIVIIAIILWSFIEKGDVIVFFSGNRWIGFDYFFRLMSFVVEPWFFVGIAVILVFFEYRHSLLIGFSGIVTLFLSKFLKSIFLQPRPYDYFTESNLWQQLPGIQDYVSVQGLSSFPSGHTMAAFSLFFSLAMIVKNEKWSILFLILGTSSGISRIYLMNHFIEDVIVGSFIGIIISISLKLFIDKLPLPKWSIIKSRKKV